MYYELEANVCKGAIIPLAPGRVVTVLSRIGNDEISI
jgi:hypothetical protein